MKLIKKYQFGGLTEKLPRAAKTPNDPTLKKMGWDYFHFEDLNPSAQGYSQAKKQHAADPNKVFLVDLKTGRLIPTSEYEANRAMSSEEIDENRTNFEVQQAQNHKALQNRDPQDLGLALMVTGAVPFLPEVLAPAMPIIKPVLTAANIGIGGYNAAQAVNDVAQGDYEGAAIKGGLALSSLAPYSTISNLSFWPKVGASLGFGAGTSALAYANEQHQMSEDEKFINNLATKQNYVITDQERDKILSYLSSLGYDTSRFNVRKYPGSDETVYDITSGNGDQDLDQSEPWYKDRGKRIGAYFGTKYGYKLILKPGYKYITGKPIIRPDWLQNFINKIPQKPKQIAKFTTKHSWSDIPYLGLEYLAYRLEDKDKVNGLTPEQKTTVANALTLLGSRYPDLQFYNIAPELQTGQRLTPYKDTTDYIPGLPQIEEYTSQPQVEQPKVDTSLVNNAPDDM